MQEKDLIETKNDKNLVNRNSTFNNVQNKMEKELNLEKVRSSKTFQSNTSLSIISLSVASKNAISHNQNNQYEHNNELDNKGASFLSNDSSMKENTFKTWISYPSKKSFFSSVFQGKDKNIDIDNKDDNQDKSLIEIFNKSNEENGVNDILKTTKSIKSGNKQANNLMNYYFGDFVNKNKNSNLDSSNSAFSFKIQTSLEISKMSKLSNNKTEKETEVNIDNNNNVNFNNIVTNEKSAELSYENFSYINEFINLDSISNDNSNLSREKIIKNEKNTPNFDKFNSNTSEKDNIKLNKLNLNSTKYTASNEFESYRIKFEESVKSHTNQHENNSSINNNTYNLNYNFFNIQGANFQGIPNFQNFQNFNSNNQFHENKNYCSNSLYNNINSGFKSKFEPNNDLSKNFELINNNFYINKNINNNNQNQNHFQNQNQYFNKTQNDSKLNATFNKFDMDSKKKYYKVENDPTIYNNSNINVENVRF